MINENELSNIFRDRMVYTLLLSHRELVLIRVDVSNLALDGKPMFHYTEIFDANPSEPFEDTNLNESDGISVGASGTPMYFEVLARWIKWASSVAMQLKEYQESLDRLEPINCWVPSSSYMSLFTNEIQQMSTMIPRPSFYNPIFKTDKRYYRIYRSYWCGNPSSRFKEIVLEYQRLFQDYTFPSSYALSCPDYGITLSSMKGYISFCQLKTVIDGILVVLEAIKPYCHMDVRAPNVIVKLEDTKIVAVHLIDFDFCTRVNEYNPMNKDYPHNPKEIRVHANSDMWSLGMLVLKLVTTERISSENYQRVLETRNIFKDTFQPHYDQLYDFIAKCLVLDPVSRLSIDQAVTLIGTWT